MLDTCKCIMRLWKSDARIPAILSSSTRKKVRNESAFFEVRSDIVSRLLCAGNKMLSNILLIVFF